MLIRSVRHRGLRRLIEDDDSRYLGPERAGRIRNVLAALILAADMDEFVGVAPAGWRAHRLIGDRQDMWSVSVSANWRITFVEEGGLIDRLHLEDYH